MEYDPGSERYRTEFETDIGLPTEAVISVVSTATENGPLALPPLFSAVDPDALNTLFASERSADSTRNGTITFEYANCLVSVASEGTVEAENL